MGFERLTFDLFKSKDYSRNELDLFTVDFIKRLKAKPLAIIGASESNAMDGFYKTFKEGLGKLATEGAQQKGGTLNRQDAFDDALDFIRRQEGLVKSKFGKQSPAYIEFYPLGLTEYNAAKVEGLTNLLVRYVTAANKYQKELGKDFITEITTLQTQYVTARDTQGTGIANNKTTQSEIRDSRKMLTMHLSKLVLLIAAVSIENAEQFNSYFNFGLLEVDNNKTTAEADVTPTTDTPPPTA
ncbi:MAG: hypothetical protein NTU43_04480 [Bacteroidetes bacterium]|nr:hypothetical protein [Bacteroidota bacterium]